MKVGGAANVFSFPFLQARGGEWSFCSADLISRRGFFSSRSETGIGSRESECEQWIVGFIVAWVYV